MSSFTAVLLHLILTVSISVLQHIGYVAKMYQDQQQRHLKRLKGSVTLDTSVHPVEFHGKVCLASNG